MRFANISTCKRRRPEPAGSRELPASLRMLKRGSGLRPSDMAVPADVDARWAAYLADRCEANRNRVAECYLPFVYLIAARIRVRLPKCVDVADLFQAGMFGLMDAVNRFEPSRGVLFQTFANRRVTGSVIDHIRGFDWVPRLTRTRQAKVAAATAALREQLGRDPTHEELAERLDVGVTTFRRRWLPAMREVKVTSLHGTREGGREQNNLYGDNRPFALAGVVEAAGARPDAEAEREEFWRRAVRGLDRDEKLVILLYYREGMTMKEVGQAFGLSESRVSQMHENLVSRLRERGEADFTCEPADPVADLTPAAAA